MENRRIKIDHENPPKWGSLSTDQKRRHNIFCSYLIQWCENNKDEYVPWLDIDENIPHIYSWIFDSYNNSHQKTKIIYDKVGVKIIKG